MTAGCVALLMFASASCSSQNKPARSTTSPTATATADAAERAAADAAWAAKLRRVAEAAAAGIRNDQFYWFIYPYGGRRGAPQSATFDEDSPRPFRGTPADRVRCELLFSDELVPRLLEALDDPDRFAAAHLLLLDRFPPEPESTPSDLERATSVPGHFFTRTSCRWDEAHGHSTLPWLRVTHDGLAFTLNRWVADEPILSGRVPSHGKDGDTHAVTGDADVSQLPAIREQWRKKLRPPSPASPATPPSP